MKNTVKVIGFADDMGVYSFETNGDVATQRTPYELERGGEEKFMRFSFAARHLRWLQGEILTVAEAVIDDERRLKATKDIIRDKFSRKMDWLYENCGLPEGEQKALAYSDRD